jgi:hypothetical protein
MAPVMGTTAVRGTAIMAVMPLLIMAATPRRTPATATLPHTTADTHRVIMLPLIMDLGTGGLFVPHTRTALDTIAAGDRQGATFRITKGRRDVCGLFVHRIPLLRKLIQHAAAGRMLPRDVSRCLETRLSNPIRQA